MANMGLNCHLDAVVESLRGSSVAGPPPRISGVPVAKGMAAQQTEICTFRCVPVPALGGDEGGILGGEVAAVARFVQEPVVGRKCQEGRERRGERDFLEDVP